MTNFITPAPFTELSAVNYVLRAIGESPISALPATQADVQMILGCFNDVCSEIQAMQQWQWNSEFGYQLQPAGQIQWSNPAQGDVEVLNVFAIPPGMASYRATPSYQQTGPQFTDLGYRRATVFNVGNVFPLVFYDRDKNREGFNAQAYPFLALDVAWFVPFVDQPYCVQLYACARTARRTVQQGVNSSEIAQFVATDEVAALRLIMRQFGVDDSYNALRTVNAFRAYGNRPATNVGFIDIRGAAPAQTETILPTLPCTVSSGTVSQPRNAAYSFSFTVTNPNSMAVSVQIAPSDGSGTVVFGSPATTVPTSLIPSLQSIQVPVTYTLANTAGAGGVILSASTFTIGDSTNIGTNNGTLSITAT